MSDDANPQAGTIRRLVRVRGRVQGVWFRRATRDEARAHAVAGWVRNCPDGSVEAVFEGPASAVEALLAFVRRGPPGARVDQLEIAEQPPRGEQGFSIAR